MIILGIDPGTARMGYSLLKVESDYSDIAKGNLKKNPKKYVTLLESAVITTSPELEMHKRLKHLYNELILVANKHKPDTMVVERLFFSTNVKTAINVGQARGVSLLVAATKKMQLFEYTALEAKLVLTGYGRSDKKEVQKAVKDILKLSDIIKSDDANDAVAIALCHLKKGSVPGFTM